MGALALIGLARPLGAADLLWRPRVGANRHLRGAASRAAAWVRGVLKRPPGDDDSLYEALLFMAVCVEAGLNLHQAVAEVGRRVDNPAGHRLQRAAVLTAQGVPLVRALSEQAEGAGAGYASFVRAVRIGQALGLPLVQSLHGQLDVLRRRQRLDVERRLGTLPLKFTFCTVLLLVPPLLVVILLPGLLAFLRSSW